MAFIQDTNGRWGLQVTLESAPPSGGASRYKIADHDLQMTLSFHPGGDPTRNRKLLQFQDRVVRAKTAQMTLWIDSLPERDEVYHAISNAAYRAKVTLQRRTQLAVENTQEVAESFQESALENNNLFLSGIDLSKSLVRTDMSRFMVKAQRTKFPKPKLNVLEVGQARDKKGRYIAAYLSVENWPRFGKQLFEFIEFKDGNRKRKGSRLNIMVVDADRGNTLQSFANFEDPEQLSKMLVRLDPKAKPVKSVSIIIEDRKTGHTEKSEPVMLAPSKPKEKTYTLHWFDFETVLAPDPFLFDPNLHAHIFAALAGPPPQPASEGLVRHREEFDGTVHSYFQDDVAQHRIYYLPDDFRIARHAGAFRPPMVTVRVQSNGTETTKSTVTFNYAMTPYTNAERLVDAAHKIATATGQDVQDLDFQPYVGPDLTLMLDRPSATGRVREDRTSSPLMLQQTVTDTLVMDVTDFQIMFDAMINQDPSALTGWVEIGVDGWDTEVLLFKANFAQLAGDTLDMSVANNSGTSASLTLTNVIESPIDLTGIRVAALRNGETKEVDGLDAATQTLAPNATAAHDIAFAGLSGRGAIETVLLEGGTVSPDATAVLNAILDRSALDFSRSIEVQSFLAMNTPPEGTPLSQVVLGIRVEFDGGQTVFLTADNPTASVKIDYPFSQVILGELADDGSYTYRKTIYYADNTEIADTEPTSGTGSLIVVLAAPNLS